MLSIIVVGAFKVSLERRTRRTWCCLSGQGFQATSEGEVKLAGGQWGLLALIWTADRHVLSEEEMTAV